MSNYTRTAKAVAAHLRDMADDIDREGRFPSQGLQLLKDCGLFSMTTPTQYGGAGASLSEFSDVAAILADGCLSTAMVWAMHCQQVDAINRYGSDQLRSLVFPKVVESGYYLASVTTEYGKGGDLLRAVAPLDRVEDYIGVQRSAPIVTGGEFADGFLVTMRDAQSLQGDQVSLVHLDRDQVSISVDGGWKGMGMRGTQSVPITLSGRAQEWQVLGQSGKFRAIATDSLIPVGHIAWASCWIGAANGVLERVLTEARSGKSSGLNASDPVFRDRIADARVSLELIVALLANVTHLVESNRAGKQLVSERALQIKLDVLKVASADLSFKVVDQMIDLAGLRYGYMRSSPLGLERTFRDLRSASLNNSNNRIKQAIGSQSLLARTAWVSGNTSFDREEE